MIVSHIRNPRTKKNPTGRGRSFKGLIDYLLYGDSDSTTKRSSFEATQNIFSDVETAAYELGETWARRTDHLKQNGFAIRQDNTAPVDHFVLSWRNDEQAPAPADRVNLAKELLALWGVSEHEAVFVCHDDTDNPHIHIVLNTIHPVTGRTNARYDYKKAQNWARAWEQKNGLIICKGRLDGPAKRAFERNTGVRRKRLSRTQWELDAEAKRAVRAKNIPAIILEDLTAHDATFTAAQLAAAVTKATKDVAQFNQVLSAIMASPELVRLAGGSVFTTKTMRDAEERLVRVCGGLAGHDRHGVNETALNNALRKYADKDQHEAREALAHILDAGGLKVIVGYAGAGKSTLLKAGVDAWKASGYNCQGLALAGRAAEGLEADTGIKAGTIAAFLGGIERGSIKPTAKDVFIIDEAGMVGTTDLDRVLYAIRVAGAKAVLVGDPEQLQAIAGGSPFRYIAEHYDHARLTKIWRQKIDWMKDATVNLAEGRTGEALNAYKAAGAVTGHDTRVEAIEALLDQWQGARDAGGSNIILAGTNDESEDINEAARARLLRVGAIGPETSFNTDYGPLLLGTGDRLLFRKNDDRMAVKNGTLGTVLSMQGGVIRVLVDGKPPRAVEVDTAAYKDFTHGYAVTIHKAQGLTVDKAFVLAGRNMDRNAAYVALSRHRDSVALFWDKQTFRNENHMARVLSRTRIKGMSLEHEVLADLPCSLAADNRGKAIAHRHEPAQRWRDLYTAQNIEIDRLQNSPLARAFLAAVQWVEGVTDTVAAFRFLSRKHAQERAALRADVKAKVLADVAAAPAPKAITRRNTSDAAVAGAVLMAATGKRPSDQWKSSNSRKA